MHLRRSRNKNKSNSVVERVKNNPGLKIFIDSGCFTLRAEPDYLSKKNLKPKDYIQQYIDWLYENQDYIFCAANYDMWETEPEITEWADTQFEKFEADTGVRIVYVWHADYGAAQWEQFCERHSYIGLNAFDASADGVNLSAMLALAQKYGTRVHGFAITDTDSLGKHLFYSVDSSTWVMGAKYGRTMAWTGNEFRQFDGDNKQRRNQYRANFIKKGVDWDLIEADGRGERSPEIRGECVKMNAIAWMDYQEYLYQRMAPRAYWNKIDETIERVPDIDQLTVQEIKAFFDEIDYGSNNGSDVDALRDEIVALFAFASADASWIAGLTDEDVKGWSAYFLGDDSLAETTDRNKLIGKCRIFCVNILAPPPSESARARTNEDDFKPMFDRPKVRVKDEDLPTETVDAEFELVDSVENTTGDDGDLAEIDDNEQGSQPQSGDDQAEENTREKGVYPDFVQALADETLKLRACLMVDTCLRVNDLARELNVAALKRDKSAAITNKKKAWKNAVAEKRFLKKQLPPHLNKDIAKWVEETDGKVDTSQAKAASKGEVKLTSERAREIGKLGGAPKGNTNALKTGMYSRKLPSLSCDACPIAGQCYMFRQGHVCAFDKEFKKLKVTTVDDAKDAMLSIVNTDMERLQRQILFETVQGGVANTDTSNLMQQVFQRVERVKNLMSEKDPLQKVTVTETKQISGPQAMVAQLMQQASERNKQASQVDEDKEREVIAAKVIVSEDN